MSTDVALEEHLCWLKHRSSLSYCGSHRTQPTTCHFVWSTRWNSLVNYDWLERARHVGEGLRFQHCAKPLLGCWVCFKPPDAWSIFIKLHCYNKSTGLTILPTGRLQASTAKLWLIQGRLYNCRIRIWSIKFSWFCFPTWQLCQAISQITYNLLDAKLPFRPFTTTCRLPFIVGITIAKVAEHCFDLWFWELVITLFNPGILAPAHLRRGICLPPNRFKGPQFLSNRTATTQHSTT